MSAVPVGDEVQDATEPVRVRRVFRAVPVISSSWRDRPERPLGHRDEHVREYLDRLEWLVYEHMDLWEPVDVALWDAAPVAHRRTAYARTV